MNKLALTAIILMGALVSISVAGAASPNVVLIVADDLGWADLACYGSDLHETPHLDALAQQGVRFTDAYAASPVCSPTRASIMTGRHPARLHMTIWRESASNRGNRRLLQPVTLDSLPLQELTVAEVLGEAGYYTAHVGKWHLGTAQAYPQAHGFQINVGGTLWGAPETFFYPYRGDSYFRNWRYVPDLEPGKPDDYLTDRLTDKAIEIIRQHKDQPFFLNLWYHTVHTPIEGKPALVRKYAGKVTDQHAHRNPDYAAMVESLDINVGRVLATLDEYGLGNNTLVVFTSDNGGFINTCKLHPGVPVTTNAPLRSGKGSCYEGGVRVPLIVRAPGGRSQAICRLPVVSCDFYPTILTATGLQPQSEHVLDGVPLNDLFTNQDATLAERDLYFHYPHYYPTTTPVSAIRSGDWKLLTYYEDEHVELYNLKSDLGESNNLVDQHPEVVDQLLAKLNRYLESVDAQHAEPNPNRQ